MDALITKVRAPYEAKLAEKLAVTDGLLYRRGNFNGTWDQLICDALMDVQGAQIAFSPGFRWGTTLLPGEAITRELMMDQMAITYPYTTLTEMTGDDDQDHPRRRGRQPVQPRPLLPAGRRHGARGRPAVHLRPDADDGRAHQRHAPERQADRSRQDLQGGRLGAGGRGARNAPATSRCGTWSRRWLKSQPAGA